MRWDRNYKQPEIINDPAVIPAYGVTDVERAYWNAKQEALEYDRYPTLRSDKHCTSGVIHRALEDYKTAAVELSQAFFWGHTEGLAQTKEACEAAAGNAAASALEASSYAASAAGTVQSVIEYARDASASANNAAASATAANNSKLSAEDSASSAAQAVLDSQQNEYDAEAWAKGTRNGVDVPSTDPAYHNNAKYYADEASSIADVIDDTTTSEHHTWSSDKINNKFEIDASTISWCQSKIRLLGQLKADLVDGKVPASQLPSYVDDIIEGYLYEGSFYEDTQHTELIEPEGGKLYVNLDDNKEYRWSGSAYSQTNPGLALGTTAGTAYEGSSGAYLYHVVGNILFPEIQDVVRKIPNEASRENPLLATSALAGVTFTTVDDEIYINW